MWILRNVTYDILIMRKVKPSEVSSIGVTSLQETDSWDNSFVLYFVWAQLHRTPTSVKLIPHQLGAYPSVHLKGKFDVMADV